MQEALDQLVADGAGGGRRRTTIVIAHRLSTVQKADKIVVMERGRIVEVPRPCARIEAAPFFRFTLSGYSRESFGAPPKLLFCCRPCACSAQLNARHARGKFVLSSAIHANQILTFWRMFGRSGRTRSSLRCQKGPTGSWLWRKPPRTRTERRRARVTMARWWLLVAPAGLERCGAWDVADA